MSDLVFDLSRSSKVNGDCVIGPPIYGFLLMVNSNIGSNSDPLRDIRLWNLSDLDLVISRPLKIKSNDVIGLPTYAFLLVVNSSIGLNLVSLRDMTL